MKKIAPHKYRKYVRESQKTRQTATYVSTETFVQSRARWILIIAYLSGQNKLIAEANMSQVARIIPSPPTTLLDFVSKKYPMYLETFKFSNVKNNGKDFAEAFYLFGLKREEVCWCFPDNLTILYTYSLRLAYTF